MTDLLEQVVRDTLQEKAGELHGATVDRVIRGAHSRHRVRSRRGPAAHPRLAFSLVCVVATVCVALVTLGSSTQPAVAAWTSIPTPPRAGQLAFARRTCQVEKPALEDTRGPYTALVYPIRTGLGLCVIGPEVAFRGTAGQISPRHLRPDQITAEAASSRDGSGRAIVIVAGRVGADVDAIAVQRYRTGSVRASVGKGWFLAWWPSSARPTSFAVATGSHTHLVQLRGGFGAPACARGTGCAAFGPVVR